MRLTGIRNVEPVLDQQLLGLLNQELLLLRARHVFVLFEKLPHDKLLLPKDRHDRVPVERRLERPAVQPQHVPCPSSVNFGNEK